MKKVALSYSSRTSKLLKIEAVVTKQIDDLLTTRAGSSTSVLYVSCQVMVIDTPIWGEICLKELQMCTV